MKSSGSSQARIAEAPKSTLTKLIGRAGNAHLAVDNEKRSGRSTNTSHQTFGIEIFNSWVDLEEML